MAHQSKRLLKTYLWVPSLYYFQGLPFAIVMIVSAIMYKDFGVSNTAITFYTSLLFIPWTLKPLLSPILETVVTKRQLTLIMQMLVTVTTILIVVSLVPKYYFFTSLAIFFLMAFFSAMHDIASDGLYMVNLEHRYQAYFVGIRTLFYQLARLSCQGGLVMLAGLLKQYFTNTLAWQIAFISLALLLLVLFLYHCKVLPESEKKRIQTSSKPHEIYKVFIEVVKTLFQLPHIYTILLFLLIYNFVETQLLKIAPLFLLDSINHGGLNLSTLDVGLLYGTLGSIGIMLGAVLSGWYIAKYKLRYCFIPMTLLVVLLNISYLMLAIWQIQSLWFISIAVIVSQFGFGLSNSAYMTYLLNSVSSTRYPMSYYAIGTAIMALGMMFAGAISGYMQFLFNYTGFFAWIVIADLAILLFTIYVVKTTCQKI